jgi:hypothetical protein
VTVKKGVAILYSKEACNVDILHALHCGLSLVAGLRLVAIVRKQKPVFLLLLVLGIAWAALGLVLAGWEEPVAAVIFALPVLIMVPMMRIINEYQRGVLLGSEG